MSSCRRFFGWGRHDAVEMAFTVMESGLPAELSLRWKLTHIFSNLKFTFQAVTELPEI